MDKEKIDMPQIGKPSFVCQHCGVLSQQAWRCFMLGNRGELIQNGLDMGKMEEDGIICISICQVCHEIHIWYKGKLVYPYKSAVPNPNKDMPEEVKKIYVEAGDVYGQSPKSAAALLRLGIQYLCVHLGGKGKNIDGDIGALAKKGLDDKIIKALDVVRVIGNEAVHPGTIDLNDNKEIAYSLFELVNFIVQQTISQEKQINELYNNLPDGIKEHIEKRNLK